MERERLLAIAPHLIGPRRFVLPYRSRLRPAWAVRLGLFLYDWLGRRSTLEPSERVRFADIAATARRCARPPRSASPTPIARSTTAASSS